ncbi:MAG: hypothetical protein M5R42_09485 [Rhodocyclaceae bacterium]|nr:hypothetical protein [Rhodocyclaceae bacterium]
MEFGGKYKVKLRVLSALKNLVRRPGTLITFEEDIKMEQRIISGIAFNRTKPNLPVLGVPDPPDIAYQILGPVARSIDRNRTMIIQNVVALNSTKLSRSECRAGEFAKATWPYSNRWLRATSARGEITETTRSPRYPSSA